MDIAFDPNDVTLPQVALYSTISFLVVTVIGVFLYVACLKKYKLNWFEKNLLETACENQEFNARYVLMLFYVDFLLKFYFLIYRIDSESEHNRSKKIRNRSEKSNKSGMIIVCFRFHCVKYSQEALLVANTIPYNVDSVDSTSLRSSNRSPVSTNETFWVPTTSQRHPSTHSDAIPTTSAGF